MDRIEYSNLYLPLYFKGQLLQAKCFEKLEQWGSAINIYQEIINKIPLMQDYVFYFLGNVHLNTNDTERALDLFQHLIEEYPDSALIAFARYQIGLIYLENNQIEQFLQESRLAVQTSLEEKFKARVLLKMSDVLWEEELFIDSLVHLKELIENRYNREQISRYEDLYVKRFQITREDKNIEIIPELSLFCAEILFNYRKYRSAEKLYKEVIANYPDQIDLPQVYYNKARAVNYQEEYTRAIEQCQYILKTFPEEEIIIRTLYLYSSALMSSGNREQATEMYQEIISKYPESHFARSAYLRLSEIEFLQDEKEKGNAILDKLISEYPQSIQAREASWQLARYYTEEDTIQKAQEYYQLIYDKFPQSNQADDTLYWLAKLNYSSEKERKKERGIYWYKTLLEQFPDSYYAFRVPDELKDEVSDLDNIISLSKNGNTIEEFKKDHFPADQIAQLSAYKAELLQSIGFYRESILETINALNRESENVNLMYLIAETYRKNGEYYRSIGWAQTLLDNFRNNNSIKKIPFQIWKYAFPAPFSSIVKEIARDYSLDPYLVWSTIREESHFNSYSESRAGARGLMQVILSTGEWIAQEVDYRNFENDLLFEPEVNIQFGCWYLHYLQEKYQENYYLMISGYNAGPGITDRWIENLEVTDIDSFIENIPYQETTEHIKKVMRSYQIYRIIYNSTEDKF